MRHSKLTPDNMQIHINYHIIPNIMKEAKMAKGR